MCVCVPRVHDRVRVVEHSTSQVKPDARGPRLTFPLPQRLHI